MKPQTGSSGSYQPGLSILVMHYNRPWCLEVTLHLLNLARSKSPCPTEIILADDGSDPAVLPHFSKFPCDQVYVQPNHSHNPGSYSIFSTFQAALSLAKYDHLLFVEDDFWLVPQGFHDVGKNHGEGLLSCPDFKHAPQTINGALDLLRADESAHFVELARGFTNSRYPSDHTTNTVYEGVHFQRKLHRPDDAWYICAWPHLARTAEVAATTLPLGESPWHGERTLTNTRRQKYGTGDWVWNPHLCYFVHMNIYTWRENQKNEYQGDAAGNLKWMEADTTDVLPKPFTAVRNFNQKLLKKYLAGSLPNDLDALTHTSILNYATKFHFLKLINDL
jgi:hypothetical protein